MGMAHRRLGYAPSGLNNWQKWNRSASPRATPWADFLCPFGALGGGGKLPEGCLLCPAPASQRRGTKESSATSASRILKERRRELTITCSDRLLEFFIRPLRRKHPVGQGYGGFPYREGILHWHPHANGRLFENVRLSRNHLDRRIAHLNRSSSGRGDHLFTPPRNHAHLEDPSAIRHQKRLSVYRIPEKAEDRSQGILGFRRHG